MSPPARRPHAAPRTRTSAPAPRGRRARAGALLRRHPYAVAALLGALHLGLAVMARMPIPHPGGDNGMYLALGRSILDGGYRDLFDPAAPPHAQFPPGWPLLIAGALALGVKPWAGLKALTAAFSALAVAASFLWVHRRRRPWLALGLGTLLAVSPGVLELSRWELSDLPFWALTMAALVAWERARGAGRTLVASLLTVAAYLTRSAGLPLLLGAAAWLAWRRRWRELGVYLAVALPPAAAWAWWTRTRGHYPSLFLAVDPYAPDRGTAGPAEMAARVLENGRLYAGRFLPELLAGAPGTAAVALSAAVLALGVLGWARRARRPGVAEAMLPVYVAMLLAWSPAFAGVRLLLPLFPLLLFYAGDAVARLGRRAPSGAAPALAGAVLLLVAIPGTHGVVRGAAGCRAAYVAGDRYPCMEPGWKDFFAVAELAPRVLPGGAAVLSRKVGLFYAVAGVPGRTYPLDRSPDSLLRTAREAGARYVVLDAIDEMAEQYLTPALIRRPRAFCVMHVLGPGRAALLGILPDAERIPDVRDDPGAAEVQVGFQRCPPDLWRSEDARRELSP